MTIFKETYNKFIDFIKTYYLSCIFAVIIAILTVEEKADVTRYLETSIYVMFGTFFIKSFFLDKKICAREVIGYIICVAMSIAIIFVISPNSNPDKESYVKIAYLMISILFVVYKCNINNKLELGTYLQRVFCNLLMLFIFECILSCGILIIYLILDKLFSTGENVIYKIELFQFALVTSLGALLSIKNCDEDINIFFKIVIRFVMFVMVLIGYIIVYVYFINIILKRSIPSNQIFMISSLLFFIGMPVALMTKSLHAGDKISNTIKILANSLPLMFIPCLLFQSFSIYVRIYHYGLTTDRYICIMIILIEITYIVNYIFKNNNFRILFTLLILYLCVGFFVPFVNCIELPLLIDKTIESRTGISPNHIESQPIKTVHGYAIFNVEKVDISGYNNVSQIIIDEEHKNSDINKYLNEIKRICETDECKNSDDYDYLGNKLKNMNNTIDIINNKNEVSKFIITEVTVNYDMDKHDFNFYSITGLLFEK